jgi:hypothetical protein
MAGRKTKAGQNAPKTGKKKRKNPNDAFLSEAAKAYKRMVMDPCNSRLVLPPLPGGNGHLIRLRTRINLGTILSNATANMGRVLFMYHPEHGTWSYKAVLDDTIPLDAPPGPTASTGKAAQLTPDHTFLAGTNVRRFRPIASCMELDNYTSSNSIAGAYAPLNPISAELHSCINAASNNPNISALDANAEYVRVGLKHVQFWRPKTTPEWAHYTNDLDTTVDVNEGVTSSYGFIYKTHTTATAFASIDFDVIVTTVYEYEAESATGIAASNLSSGIYETIEKILANVPDTFWKWGGHKAMELLGVRAPTPYQLLM